MPFLFFQLCFFTQHFYTIFFQWWNRSSEYRFFVCSSSFDCHKINNTPCPKKKHIRRIFLLYIWIYGVQSHRERCNSQNAHAKVQTKSGLFPKRFVARSCASQLKLLLAKDWKKSSRLFLPRCRFVIKQLNRPVLCLGFVEPWGIYNAYFSLKARAQSFHWSGWGSIRTLVLTFFFLQRHLVQAALQFCPICR